jgi:uncharacterized integral membrane protein
MKLPTLLLLLILAAFSAFASLNWRVFVTPTELSLGFTSVQMPLGMIMLGLLVFVTALFLIFVVYLQTSTMLEIRRHSRELKASRDLADKAEASRFTELRNAFEAEMGKQANLGAESRSAVLARVDLLATELRAAIDESGNTLAAYIGELEDRLDQTKTAPPAA